MNARAVVTHVIGELVEQAASLGYDFACKVAPGGDGTAVLYVRDLDTNDVETFALTVEALS